jgi:hypothetical protein
MKRDKTAWVTLASSALARVAFDHCRRLLHVEFCDGTVYAYLDVPPTIYQQLLNSPSHGAYFNANIRNRFALSAHLLG